MSAHFNSFSIHKQNQSWPAFRWLLLMITFVILSGCQTSGSIGGLTIPEAYREGLKKEVAKDYKGAIAYYDEAIDNFARFPRWLAKGAVKQAMDPKQLTDDMIANPEKIWMPHRVYLHRAQSKKALGDIAGEKADLALYENQRVQDKEILGDLMDEDAARKAEAAKDAGDAKASAEDKRKAEACVKEGWGTYTNICDRPIKVYFKNAILTTKCKTNLSGVLGTKLSPGETVKIPLECASDIRYGGASLY